MWKNCLCFLEIVPLKKADAETIYCTLIECLKKKNLQVGRIVDGAATFTGHRTGVQARIKKHTPHTLFVHCHCSWPVFKLPIKLLALLMFTKH